jgi:hypothetical protein
MAIVEIKIDTIEPFADGQAFGEAGSYLRIKGIAKGEIDPAALENSIITDLDKASSATRVCHTKNAMAAVKTMSPVSKLRLLPS